MRTEDGADAADVSVCIPAYQAAGFIDRTLDCARAQTHARLRILVAVDPAGDETEAICRRHAAEDARVEVLAHVRRLGWSENANALLERVRTPFFFLYFHDDIIAPDYVASLRAALLSRPDAASAHCDLERFGTLPGFDSGNAYEGSASRRLLAFLVGPVKGTPLRSLVRRAALSGDALRFPAIGEAGFWRCHPFLLQLLAAGPALHVPRTLYRRWMRDEGLVANWGVRDSAPLLEGQRESARLCLQRIDSAADGDERALLRHALYLFVMAWTRREEMRFGAGARISAAQLHPALAEAAEAPACLAAADAVLRGWFAQASAELAQLEAGFAAVPT